MTSDGASWTFYGFQTKANGRVVQEWFNALSDEEKDEVRDTLGYLQHLNLREWKYPKYEPLGDGISSFRFQPGVLNIWIRIYGSFWPPKVRFSYTLLYGGNKKVRNDTHGKKEALRRKRLLEQGEATVHEFKF
ncbi:MAG: hypothetical protein ABSH47_03185 [Bryobacteraceae bacterium]